MKKTGKFCILRQGFFLRHTRVVARQLLGKYLVRRKGGKAISRMITETEAYAGAEDLSSHASNGRTPRNQAMFGAPGHWYVYFIYGMYHCLNIVTERKGRAAAVLIRGVEGYNGPGKLCRAFAISQDFYGKPATKASGLWIEDRGTDIKALGYKVKTTPRINVGGDSKAKKRLWRFVLER